ncbi:transcriptional activator RamA [Klebsiella michiganensis]|nr:transcriptional activator RamA [Klebsiella michiganensis]
MTISAQVIDTIVEWIDDNLHQPLRIDDIARHAGYSKWHLQRLFLQYKGESLGRYIASVSCCWRPAICAIPNQRVYDICLKYGFDSQQTFTRIFTRTFNQPPGAYRKENHSRATEKRPPGEDRRTLFYQAHVVRPRETEFSNRCWHFDMTRLKTQITPLQSEI